MAKTNFSALDVDEIKVWSRDVWHQAREKMFINKFIGTGSNAMIQRITELTKSSKGTEAIVTLVPDLLSDGIVGDNTLTGNEATLTAHQDKLSVDQLRQAITNTGRLNDQKTIVNFRTEVRDQLSFWLADRIDQLSFLTLAGLDFAQNNDGSDRADQATNNLSQLSFNTAGGLTATTDRHLMVKADGSLEQGNTSTLVVADTIGYKHIVNLQATAKTRYVRGIRGNGGDEIYHLFLHPLAMAKLKLDDDFLANARNAGVRGDANSLWKGGSSYVVDGLMIHEFRHVPTTLGLGDNLKFGTNGNVEGCTAVLCGAQAMAFIDLESASWDERDHFDYGNNFGIAYAKIFGMKKMQFKDAKKSSDLANKEDYGVIRLDMSIGGTDAAI